MGEIEIVFQMSEKIDVLRINNIQGRSKWSNDVFDDKAPNFIHFWGKEVSWLSKSEESVDFRHVFAIDKRRRIWNRLQKKTVFFKHKILLSSEIRKIWKILTTIRFNCKNGKSKNFLNLVKERGAGKVGIYVWVQKRSFHINIKL